MAVLLWETDIHKREGPGAAATIRWPAKGNEDRVRDDDRSAYYYYSLAMMMQVGVESALNVNLTNLKLNVKFKNGLIIDLSYIPLATRLISPSTERSRRQYLPACCHLSGTT